MQPKGDEILNAIKDTYNFMASASMEHLEYLQMRSEVNAVLKKWGSERVKAMFLMIEEGRDDG